METGILVKASVKGYFRQETFFCTSRSLDKSGMLIESFKVLARGDVVTCSLFMPEAGRVRAEAEVVDVSKRKGGASRYDLRFMRITPEHEAGFAGALAGSPA